MTADVRIEIASGISIVLVDGWQLEAVGEISHCYEITLVKQDANVCLRFIALGGQSLDSAFDQFRFSLLESLVALGCSIKPADAKLQNVITASHPDKSGEIIHYIRKTNPLIHLSAAGVTSEEQKKELMLLADLIVLDTSDLIEGNDFDFGQIVPLKLNKDFWIGQ